MPSSKHFFEYEDPLVWLRDLIQARKQRGLPCSFRWLSQQAGYTSPNFFKLILDGQRSMTDEVVRHVVRIFKMNPEEAQYFRTLVQFHKAKDSAQKVLWADRLLQARPPSAARRLSQEQFEYYSKWWFVIVREALLLHSGVRSAEELGELYDWDLGRPQIEEALTKLQEIGLVSRGENGEFKPTARTLQLGDGIARSSIYAFHKQMLSLAEKALMRYKTHEREFHTLTLQVTPEKYQRVREALQRFKKEVLEITDSGGEPGSIYQLNLQLFPIARPKKGIA